MTRFVPALSLVVVSFAAAASAQEPGNRDFVPPPPPVKVFEREEPSPSDLNEPSMTPEIWLFLQQQKRHDDPKQAVRRKAEQKSADRQARLAAMKWYGYSNLRPMASASPWMGTYSPYWAGNSWDPYQHVGIGSPRVAVQVEHYDYRR
jgi:hypothetical protein